MKRYYTRACNFYYGKESRILVDKKKSLPLNGSNEISFDSIEIISRTSKKKIYIKNLCKLPKLLKKKIRLDLKVITSKKKNFANLSFNKLPNIMGVLNLTPDSFSDGGKYNSRNKAVKHGLEMFKSGANIIDVGGESTRPGSKTINKKLEWKRIHKILKSISKKIPISLDTRKSEIMEKGIMMGVKIINDISGLEFDHKTKNVLRKYKTPFVIQHSKGTPENMQIKPSYKNELLDIYDFFESKIKFVRSVGIKHNNIIIDPGIGFGKNLKHNMSLISNISIFHTLGFPVLVGNSRKRFIKELSGKNDTSKRIGGTVASSIYLMTQGVQILRIHDVNELVQGLKVYKEMIKN
jgi:dihydropteroate synthase